MLNMYQLWLDDLHPRAKFADALTIVEKLGHSKRLQMMRKEWIDEGKPRATTEVDLEEDIPMPDREATDGDGAGIERAHSPTNVPGENPTQSALERPIPPQQTAHVNGEAEADEPDEDELDALLAETSAPSERSHTRPTTVSVPHRNAFPEEEDFMDDLEAMAEMEEMW